MRGVGLNARGALAVTACAAALPLAACGGSDKQDVDEPSGEFTVEVTRANFPPKQRLAQRTRMVIAVRNTGTEKVPIVAVTLRSGQGSSSSGSGGQGAGLDAFGYRSQQEGLADPTRPIWIVDRGPKQFLGEGPGGGVTAYVSTWALGSLKPGQTKTFQWYVTPVRPGDYNISWRVSAGLDGKAKAKLRDGGVPRGAFPVKIDRAPEAQKVADNGEVVAADAPSSGKGSASGSTGAGRGGSNANTGGTGSPDLP